MQFFTINEEYLNYLRQFDKNISYTLNYNKNRPFIGIVLENEKGFGYYIPITSKHKKYSKITTEPINNGKNGYILFNNMIPVYTYNVKRIDLKILKNDTKKEIGIKLMRQYELKDINKKEKQIIKKAVNLIDLYSKWSDAHRLKKICCNFPLLEEKCKEYNSIQIKQQSQEPSISL